MTEIKLEHTLEGLFADLTHCLASGLNWGTIIVTPTKRAELLNIVIKIDEKLKKQGK